MYFEVPNNSDDLYKRGKNIMLNNLGNSTCN